MWRGLERKRLPEAAGRREKRTGRIRPGRPGEYKTAEAREEPAQVVAAEGVGSDHGDALMVRRCNVSPKKTGEDLSLRGLFRMWCGRAKMIIESGERCIYRAGGEARRASSKSLSEVPEGTFTLRRCRRLSWERQEGPYGHFSLVGNTRFLRCMMAGRTRTGLDKSGLHPFSLSEFGQEKGHAFVWPIMSFCTWWSGEPR